MSKMMIYALAGTVGGMTEKVWGHEMQVMTIDASNQKAVEAAKENGYHKSPQDVIDLIEAKQMQAENAVMRGRLDDSKDKERIAELEDQVTTALTEVADLQAENADLKDKLAIYEETKDVNGDGKVSYDEMSNDELRTLLDRRGVEYKARDNKDDLVQKAKDSE